MKSRISLAAESTALKALTKAMASADQFGDAEIELRLPAENGKDVLITLSVKALMVRAASEVANG